MPIRWTSENDQLLLITILETHEINLDFQKVANAWRSNGETPTPRAIKERITRIRTIIKNAGTTGVLNMGGGNSTTATPKSAKSAASTPKTPVSSKRKRAPAAAAVYKKKNKKDGDEEGSESDVMDIDTPSKKPANTAVAAGSILKTEDGYGSNGVVVKNEEIDNGPEKEYGDATVETSGPQFVLEDFVNMGRMADITDFTAVKSEDEV